MNIKSDAKEKGQRKSCSKRHSALNIFLADCGNDCHIQSCLKRSVGATDGDCKDSQYFKNLIL